MEKELAENPRLNVDAVRTMMSAAGQKPNEAKVRQTYNQIIKQQKQALADSKKKKKGGKAELENFEQKMPSGWADL